MANKIPKDWHGPMKACAKILREEGVKTTWNSQLVKQMMLWGMRHLLFYDIHHGKQKRVGPHDLGFKTK